jgi:hypothetical protein
MDKATERADFEAAKTKGERSTRWRGSNLDKLKLDLALS